MRRGAVIKEGRPGQEGQEEVGGGEAVRLGGGAEDVGEGGDGSGAAEEEGLSRWTGLIMGGPPLRGEGLGVGPGEIVVGVEIEVLVVGIVAGDGGEIVWWWGLEAAFGDVDAGDLGDRGGGETGEGRIGEAGEEVGDLGGVTSVGDGGDGEA